VALKAASQLQFEQGLVHGADRLAGLPGQIIDRDRRRT